MKFKSSFFLFVALSSFILSSCGTVKTKKNSSSVNRMGKNTESLGEFIKQKPNEVLCQDHGHQVFKEFRLNNNLWGKAKVRKGAPTLCTYKKGNLVGWEWKVPRQAGGVVGYPAIQVGPGPWGNTEIKQGFPIKINSVDKLSVEYDADYVLPAKKYNLSFDLWISESLPSSKEKISTEIMIWEDEKRFGSHGKTVDQITTPFGVYEVRKDYLKNEEWGQDWNYIAFLRKDKRNKGTVDLAYLIRYMVKKGWLNPEHYLMSIEFGNEISNNNGFTVLREFKVIR